MGPENFKFGGGVTETVLHPAVLVFVLIAGIVICVASRRQALAAFIAAAILIPTDQVLLLAGLHFPMLRVLVLFGFVRILREGASLRWRVFSSGMNKINIAMMGLAVLTAVNGMLLFRESAAVINQLGVLYSTFGVYFLLRFLIRTEEDTVFAIRSLIYVAMIVAAVMGYEFVTGHNPYAVLGGARASLYATLAARADRFRAQGPFAHSILAGVFGATLMPLFVSLWWKGKQHRALLISGVVACTVITLTSNSSTPVLAYAAGVLVLCLWPARRWTAVIRWGSVLALVCLHLVMKNPVWHLIARIDVTGGSSGWQRYALIDQCIHHFGDWWLLGVKDTSAWGWDMWDTCNQYVSTAESSGLLCLVLLIAVIVYVFKSLGNARRRVRGRDQQFLWALSAAGVAQAVAFFGVSYFDQTVVVWYGLLAVVSAAAVSAPQKKTVRAAVRTISAPSFVPHVSGGLDFPETGLRNEF